MSSLRSQILSDVMEEKDILLKYQEAVDTAMGEHPHPHPSHPQQQLLGLGLPPLVMQRQPPAPCSSSSPASSSPSPSDAFTKAASLLLQQSSSHLRHPPHPLGKHSVFTGVIRRKNRWEAHVWVKGKQKYLGGYTEEREAARAYDLAVVKIRGIGGGETNFPLSALVDDLKRFRADETTTEQFIQTLREEAKRKNKQRKEELENGRIAMLKRNVSLQPCSRQAKRSRINHALEEQQQHQHQQHQHLVQSKMLQSLTTEVLLDKYLEVTRRDKEKRSNHHGEISKAGAPLPHLYSTRTHPVVGVATPAVATLDSPQSVLQQYSHDNQAAKPHLFPPQQEQSQKMFAISEQKQQQVKVELTRSVTSQFSRETSSPSQWSDWRLPADL